MQLGWVVAAGVVCLSLLRAPIAAAQIPLDSPEGGPPYLGQYELGFYRNGSNEAPESHRIEGLARANAVVPLDANGNPDPVNGRIVMMSIGMSNTMIPFCDPSPDLPPLREVRDPANVRCAGWTFMGRMRSTAAIDAVNVQIVNGAYIGQPASSWVNDNTPTFNPIPPNPNIPSVVGNYDRVRDFILPNYVPVVTEAQVQILWIKLVNDLPTPGLPAANADAHVLRGRLGMILRFAKLRYPNVSIAFLTPSSYRGWAGAFNPEPQAYETGFAVKWVIDAQITQMETNNAVIDPVIGDLDYTNDTVPWITWGPYLWANGPESRLSDDMSWARTDYIADGVHHTQAGLSKFGLTLQHFFTFNRYSHCWLVGDGACE